MESEGEIKNEENGDFEVGYRRPPVHSRFKKGRSGNPNGRPKGTKNLRSDLTEELQEKITVKEGDRAIRVSKQRAVIKVLVTRTLKGDPQAAKNLLNAFFKLIDPSVGEGEPDQRLSDNEEELLAAIYARREHQMTGKPSAGEEGSKV
jgi:hypothetical protein